MNDMAFVTSVLGQSTSSFIQKKAVCTRHQSTKLLQQHQQHCHYIPQSPGVARVAQVSANGSATTEAKKPSKRDGSVIRGRVFVVGNNIDTDQIIPAEYLTLVPSDPEEYAKLGTFAMDGLPQEEYPTRYVSKGALQTEFSIIVAGDNFGCGSSREHAPVAIGAAGGCAVVAQSYARIFFRNCSATGELYPWELDDSVSIDEFVQGFTTGQNATIDFDMCEIRNEDNGKVFKLKPLGDVLPVIDAGGIFEYARQTGMIAKK